MIRRIVLLGLAVLLCFLPACAPSPSNTQIEVAIRASLSAEASPPVLDFDRMEVPVRSAGKATAVLWTEDDEIQRSYFLKYDRKSRAFAVTSFTASRKSEDGTYYPVSDYPDHVLTEFAQYFGFSEDFSQQYLLLYAGEGNDLTALRTEFESENLSNMSASQLAEFGVCDLGGDALILFVPRYRGISLWINELQHRGDMMMPGEEVARFEDNPVYIYCDFSDMLPGHEIHISVDGHEDFFTTRGSFLTGIK